LEREVTESVGWSKFAAGATDAHGNPTESWGAATSVDVIAFDPGGTAEPGKPGHDRVITEPTLYVSPPVVFGARDRVTVRGLLYEVVGDTREWRHPNGWTPGNVIELRRVEG
jgi:hypothetical protein